ncbi:MAG TPA: ABC transporter ATP-binding protein [Candidatus Merdenecus merdavium]|nr:ABC transporter ATP-binding protein [Candidatus Merdenecus merdavium]
MIKIEKLEKSFGQLKVLDQLDLEVPDGAVYGFIGTNGAGKTTSLKIMSGLLKADRGSVTIDGLDVEKDFYPLKEVVGYMPDEFGVYDNLKVIEYLNFFASIYDMGGREYHKKMLHLLDIVGLADKEELYVDDLSRGMKQRLCLARSMVHNPKVLILDEPASGLDPKNRAKFKDILFHLKEEGKTIIISSHILSEISQICSHVGFIHEGKMLLEGRIDDILSQVDIMNPLRITVYNGIDEAILFLKKDPFIKKISIYQNELIVQYLGDKLAETQLLKRMLNEGILISSFVREQGDLESLFMQMTD